MARHRDPRPSSTGLRRTVASLLIALTVVLGGCGEDVTGRSQVQSRTAEGFDATLTVPGRVVDTPRPTDDVDGGTTTPGGAGAVERIGQPRKQLVINGVGDVNLDPAYIPALAANGYQHALAGMDGLFEEDDLTIINLECPATTVGRKVPKQFNFQCDPAALPVIARQGVEVANQANNHSLDYGPEAMLDSLANIEAAGIASVGTGATVEAANEPAMFEVNGWTVAILGFGGVIPAGDWLATPGRPGMSDGDTVASMVAAVEAADSRADIVVVTIHWGKELQSGPPADDIVRARAMIDAGADAIFGHHPHRLNALEWYEGRPIAWSLGNFVWPRMSAAGSDTAVAQVIINPDGTVDACLLDATIVSGGHPTLDDPRARSCVRG